jgi:hypothetical protein
MALCANFPTECSSSLCRTTWSGKLIGPENHFPSLPVKQFKPEKLALWRKTFSIDGFFGGHWSMSLEGTSEQGAGSEGQTVTLAMEFTLRCRRVGAFEKITFSEILTTMILTKNSEFG